MAKKEKPAYHHGSLRSGLIEEALSFLNKNGRADFSMRDLAAKLNVSHSAAYRHFRNRESLLAAIALEGFNRMAEQQRLVTAAIRDPMERLKKLGLTYVTFAIKHPAHFRVMFGPEFGKKDEYPDLARAARATFQPIVEEIALGQKERWVVKGDPESLAIVLWSTVHGLSMLLVDEQIRTVTASPKPGGAPALAVLITNAILKGITKG
jgi:AcrR family transcriptional regulator